MNEQLELYTMAIISGLLASGEHTLDSIKSADVRFEIANTAAYIASVNDCISPPAHACRATVDAVIECLTHYMSEPRILVCALEHLTQLGFTEDVARYAYSAMIQDGYLTLDVENGVPVLARNA